MKEYKYGMRLRGFSPGCQPKEGFIRREDDNMGDYYDIVVYNRPLTEKELSSYELDDLNLRTFRVTYEIVLDIKATDQYEAINIANDMIANGDFAEEPMEVKEI